MATPQAAVIIDASKDAKKSHAVTKSEQKVTREAELPSFSSLISFSKAAQSVTPHKNRCYIYVIGDSNSQGLLPAKICDFDASIGMGKCMKHPWPFVMQTFLRSAGIQVSVKNHSDSGRRLRGKTYSDAERCSAGEKDGRVALQEIVGHILNAHEPTNTNITLIINLGTNDLTNPQNNNDLALQRSFIIFIATILIEPRLKYYFKNFNSNQAESKKISELFLEKLSKFIVDDIASKQQELQKDSKKFWDEYSAIFNTENQKIMTFLLKQLGWKIVLIPPVLINKKPFGENHFVNSELSAHWEDIVKSVVQFFGVPNIFALEGAQKICLPEAEEYGGSVHLTEEQHALFGQSIAKMLLSLKMMNLSAYQSIVSMNQNDLSSANKVSSTTVNSV